MIEAKNTSLFEILLKEGLVIDESTERQLHQKGYKTAIIAFEEQETNLLIKLNKKSINGLFERIDNHPKFTGKYTKSQTHFANFDSLFNNQVVLYSFLEKRESPDVTDLLAVLDKAPWMERTTEFISQKLKIK